MSEVATRVLLIEGNAADSALVEQALAGAVGKAFRIESVRRLAAALERLGNQAFEVILLDFALPDCRGIEAFDQVAQAAPDALILILSSADDESAARQAVQRGADDYLVKGHVDSHWLPRALYYLLDRKNISVALRSSEARFRAISDASPLGIFVSDVLGSCVYTNAAYQKISGLSFEQTLGTNWLTAIHPDDRERVLAEWRGAAMGWEPFQTEYRFLRDEGSVVWTRVSSAPMFEGERARGRVKTIEDISERKVAELALQAAEEALFDERERAQVTLNSIGDAVLTTDASGNVTYLNLVAETMTGWTWKNALGRPLPEVFHIIDGATREIASNPAQRAVKEDRTVGLAADCVLVRRDGYESAIEDSAAPIHNRDGRDAGAVIVFHDVSKSRAMALKMAHLAQHDFLTDLPNRVLLTERLTQAISLAKRHKSQVALLFIDLDHFKHINDSLGHTIGDQLLQSAADRLSGCVRTSDTVCRQGGDEFVILLPEIVHPQDTTLVAEKLIEAFALPHVINGQELHITLSIGISLYPDDGNNVETVMQNADTAMYHAKENGRNTYRFFTSEMNTLAVRRQQVVSSLRRALKQGEFFMVYQPQVDLASGAMTGAEALIRWLDPNLGVLYPKQFVSIAEECGLIIPIGRWVLREVCRQASDWLKRGLFMLPVSVNISALEFRQKDFVASIALILEKSGLPPAYLELELTESLVMQDAEVAASMLQELKQMGVKLAIDDFGTGYSSLSYLNRFPIDTLKIDQSFVHDIASDADGGTIVGAVIAMGINLKQRVVAEGVETPAQLEFLRARQCAAGQGLWFSPPLPAADYARLLIEQTVILPLLKPMCAEAQTISASSHTLSSNGTLDAANPG